MTLTPSTLDRLTAQSPAANVDLSRLSPPQERLALLDRIIRTPTKEQTAPPEPRSPSRRWILAGTGITAVVVAGLLIALVALPLLHPEDRTGPATRTTARTTSTSSAGTSPSAAGIVKTVSASCQNISIVSLFKEYRDAGYAIAVADIGSIGSPSKISGLPGGDLVYSDVSLSNISSLHASSADLTSPARVLGGTANDLTVVADPPSGLISGQRALVVLRRTAGVGETLANAYLIAGDSVILDGVCQKPGDLPTTPAPESVKNLLAAAHPLDSSPSTTVAVSLALVKAAAKG